MKFDFDVLIVGNGVAGYGAADRLYEKGIKNICIVTENKSLSTSRCSGSDKQTYYKLDIASPEGDSVRKMAEDLFNGGSMNGSDAYLEAANSLPCFMHLVEIGVPFPTDEYGVYQGYRTDHDNTGRATSCGPLTSKYMTEMLEKRVRSNNTVILDGYRVIKLDVSDGVCFGAYCLCDGEIKHISAEYTVLCTGAPADIYADSVYPVGHRGATGLAIEAGAQLSNFQEWQYGIASKKFRWNLSGSYQQVIPRYISVDSEGNEKELMSDFPDDVRRDFLNRIFLKGYEWPFNSDKTDGSSFVDIQVMNEISQGRKVYLDYTKNPDLYDFSLLSDEAKEYLKKAGVDGRNPIDRLRQLNKKAVELYLDNGIDLSCERLEIGVCSQHNNGGIKVDSNGETTVRNLFCSGEASGRFGVFRPGGAALNDTQVGALLISTCIAKRTKTDFERRLSETPMLPSLSDVSNIEEINLYFGRKMSDFAGVIRVKEELGSLISELESLIDGFSSKVKISSISEYGKYFSLYHTSLARLALCRTELASLDKCGSRGGCMCIDGKNKVPENREFRKYITVTSDRNVTFTEVDKIPDYECAFEKLLRVD